MSQAEFIFRVKDLAKCFHRTPRTVRRWIADGLLRPGGYRRIGGSALEMVFTCVEIAEFMDRYIIKPEDLAIENPPRGKEARAGHVARLIGTARVLSGKASAAAMAKLLRGQ